SQMCDVVVRVEADERIAHQYEMVIRIQILTVPSAVAGGEHEQRQRRGRARISEMELQRVVVQYDRPVRRLHAIGKMHPRRAPGERNEQKQRELKSTHGA